MTHTTDATHAAAGAGTARGAGGAHGGRGAAEAHGAGGTVGAGAGAVHAAGGTYPAGRAYAEDGAVGTDMDTAVSAAQHGDESAFRVVYRAVQPQLLGYVRGLVGPADAEDVASEAWLQIARDLPSFRGDGASVRGWAARIARNRALDHLRARSRRPVPGAGVDELVLLPDRADTAGEALDAVATDRALAAVAALPREQAEAVMLRVVMGLDSTAAARVLGKRAGSVRMAAHRGLRRLAEVLPADPSDDASAAPARSVPPAAPAVSGPPVLPAAAVGSGSVVASGSAVVSGPVVGSAPAVPPVGHDASARPGPVEHSSPARRAAVFGRGGSAQGGVGTGDRAADGAGDERMRGSAAEGAVGASGRGSGGTAGDGLGSAEHAPDAEAERDALCVRAAVRK